jgi:hypothetical protein
MADKLRNMGFGYIPYDEIINARVIMNETVSHAGDFLSFNLRDLFSYLLGNLLSRLSHDLDASDKGSFPEPPRIQPRGGCPARAQASMAA